jgi:hypothetical protein
MDKEPLFSRLFNAHDLSRHHAQCHYRRQKMKLSKLCHIFADFASLI